MSFDEIVLCLSVEDQKVIGDMMVLFESIDGQTKEFAGQTGLKCKSGCGACCTNPDVETTVAEVLPLAVHLWSNGQGEGFLEDGSPKFSKSICVFYKPDPVRKDHGSCSIYAYRPGLCRLFGFAARKDKHGQNILVTCKVIKDSQPQVCKQTQEGLKTGALGAPLLNTHAFAVSNIDPVHGGKLFPINEAISLAVEKVGYIVPKKQNKGCRQP